jgi:hypothetical protein
LFTYLSMYFHVSSVSFTYCSRIVHVLFALLFIIVRVLFTDVRILFVTFRPLFCVSFTYLCIIFSHYLFALHLSHYLSSRIFPRIVHVLIHVSFALLFTCCSRVSCSSRIFRVVSRIFHVSFALLFFLVFLYCSYLFTYCSRAVHVLFTYCSRIVVSAYCSLFACCSLSFRMYLSHYLSHCLAYLSH